MPKTHVTYRNFIHCAAQGFIFAYVPKVACTNWKAVFRYLSGFPDWLDSALAHDKRRGGLRYLDLTGPDRKLLRDPAIRKFAMVRNPWTRALAAYLNKVETRLASPAAWGKDPYFDSVVQAIDRYRIDVLGAGAFPAVDFGVFLRWVENAADVRDGMANLRQDEHWQTQATLLRWQRVEYDFVGRFENIAADAVFLLGQMGCDVPFPTQRDVKFAPTGADGKLAAYLTPENSAIIARLYADDLDAFGYAPPAA